MATIPADHSNARTPVELRPVAKAWILAPVPESEFDRIDHHRDRLMFANVCVQPSIESTGT